jgi:cellulose synthase/poly-beta-1,6-N-acetylglucosamine synthase-like glycosyltransferase
MEKFNIVIPAYNEGKNLRILIPYLLSFNLEKLDKIYVVDSASNDITPEVMNYFIKRYPNIVYIREEKRNGKASAINKALDLIHDGIVIIHSADCFTDKESLIKLVKAINGKIGASMPSVEPLMKYNNVCEKLSYYSWFIANMTSQELYNLDMLHHLGHDIFAFRRDLIDKLNEKAINDDSLIALKISKNGYKIAFVDGAKVKLKATSELRDLILQRMRINYGHKFNRKLTGHESTTLKNILKIKPLLGLKILIKSIVKRFPESLIYIPFLIIFEIFIDLFLLLKIYRFDFIKWPLALSTKNALEDLYSIKIEERIKFKK